MPLSHKCVFLTCAFGEIAFVLFSITFTCIILYIYPKSKLQSNNIDLFCNAHLLFRHFIPIHFHSPSKLTQKSFSSLHQISDFYTFCIGTYLLIKYYLLLGFTLEIENCFYFRFHPQKQTTSGDCQHCCPATFVR